MSFSMSAPTQDNTPPASAEQHIRAALSRSNRYPDRLRSWKAKRQRIHFGDCRQHALGDSDGTVTINIAGNAGQSSSVLPMLKSHQNAFPPANYVGTQEASIHRLDSVAPEFLGMNGVAFLKVDVQGFEKQVLAGGKSTIDDHCVGMQLELSFLPLYEGGMLIPEALDLVYSLGFTLTGLLPCFIDANNGRMLQADGIFFREDD